MNNQNKKQIIKSAFSMNTNDKFEYLSNLSLSHAYNLITDAVNSECREIENINWKCASCQCPIHINAIIFSDLKEDDYLCKKCADFGKSNALRMGILKSSNNLMMILKNKLYKNYGK